MTDETRHIGKVSRQLVDNLSRCEVSLEKALDRIGKALVKTAVDKGFEVLASREDENIPLVAGLDSASIFARDKASNEVGYLNVNSNGVIEFRPIPNDVLEDMMPEDEIDDMMPKYGDAFDREWDRDLSLLYG